MPLCPTHCARRGSTGPAGWLQVEHGGLAWKIPSGTRAVLPRQPLASRGRPWASGWAAASSTAAIEVTGGSRQRFPERAELQRLRDELTASHPAVASHDPDHPKELLGLKIAMRTVKPVPERPAIGESQPAARRTRSSFGSPWAIAFDRVSRYALGRRDIRRRRRGSTTAGRRSGRLIAGLDTPGVASLLSPIHWLAGGSVVSRVTRKGRRP